MSGEKLPKRQLEFANAFIETGNASEAARRAGYSAKTAGAQGSRLLKNVKVASYVRARMEDREKQQVASADEVVRFYTAVMRGEVRDSFGLEASLADRLAAGRELMRRYDAVEGRVQEGVTIVDDVREEKPDEPRGDQ